MINTKNNKLKKIKYLQEITNYNINENNKDITISWENDILNTNNKPILRLTSGIISSYLTKEETLSIYKSTNGIYFDSTQDNNLDLLLRSSWQPDSEDIYIANLSIEMIKKYRITKTNEYPDVSFSFFSNNEFPNILLIDQIIDSPKVILGNSNEQTFNDMLLSVFHSYPNYNIYVKLHPDTINHNKEGYLQKLLKKYSLLDYPLIHVINENYNVISFFDFVEEIFVVTSQVGFEAILRDKKVTCYGLPFYSGWGLTNDMQVSKKTKPNRNTVELFVAIMIKYTKYLNPFTKKLGTILDLLEYISLQKRHSLNKKAIIFNTNKNNSLLVKKLFKNYSEVNSLSNFHKHEDKPIIFTDHIHSYEKLSKDYPSSFIREGFLFPNSLNNKKASSIILDYSGAYFNPSIYSDLDFLLNYEYFTEYEYLIAEKFLINYEKQLSTLLSKESSENLLKIINNSSNKKIVFIIGQDENSELLFYGKQDNIQNNFQLISEVCKKTSNSLIIYKPPSNGINKYYSLFNSNSLQTLKNLANKNNNSFYIEKKLSFLKCISLSEEIHTINSNFGLDAIIQSKKVFTYGLPFYGGYGLTNDMYSYPKEKSSLSILDLILGTYIYYPIYYMNGNSFFMNANNTLEKNTLLSEKYFQSYNIEQQNNPLLNTNNLIIEPILKALEQLKTVL